MVVVNATIEEVKEAEDAFQVTTLLMPAWRRRAEERVGRGRQVCPITRLYIVCALVPQRPLPCLRGRCVKAVRREGWRCGGRGKRRERREGWRV